ncbi:PepSY-associated TM helix domain-containing protein [Acetobacter persici]|uniref:PepSY-associated TM helix domain-containing protein n=1 Tax=Acetobacter persici TaxID=1076596 RepID=UPI001BAE32AA|nr:PepSY-associated TM helix domain-containing protein [Acetobacter persici]MBS1016320.1 PepSY domain-containing protein [Acetobacter persici]
MKLRADFVQLYRDVHSWVGIIAGLFLFVAFYAGAVTMFEEPLQSWASAPVVLPPPVSLERTPELLQKALAAHPEARTDYTIAVTPEDAQRGRLTWDGSGGQVHHAPTQVMAAGLDAEGNLVVVPKTPSAAARFVDVLHQQVGLPLPHTPAMILMGIVALLYAIALVSGVIAYLPALVKTLFAVRLGQSVRKRWLDLHNLLGLFSLPFHLVMAISSVVFAFHGQIFALEHLLFSAPVAGQHGGMQGGMQGGRHGGGPGPRPGPGGGRDVQSAVSVTSAAGASAPVVPGLPPVLAPTDILALVTRQAPGFVPEVLNYMQLGHGKDVVRVFGYDARYPTRGPTGGFMVLNSRTGAVQSGEYMPGHQPAKFAILTSFFALHFGSFGGTPVRWGYVVLGLAGAFLFYTGNQLWIVSRRRRERQSGDVVETRGTRLLAALTTGCTTGCVAGISAVFCAVPVLPFGGTYGAVSAVYYSVFCLFVGAAFCLPGQRGIRLLLGAAGVVTACVPLMLCLHGAHLLRTPEGLGVAGMAGLLSAFLFAGAVKHTREI